MYHLSMENSKNNKVLICVDTSYALYFIIFGAVAEFQKKQPELASTWIKPPEECDQSNLPDLLNCEEFKKILKRFVMKRIETIDWIAKENFQNEIDIASGIDIVLAMDDRVSYSFRKRLYPEYKAQRALVKRSYKIQTIKDYIINVLFKELEVEEKHGFKLVKVEGAEGDDVIATTLMNFKDKYLASMLIASDHDFLQLDGVRIFDLFGREAKRDLGGEEVSANDYLLGKILMGDKSDNIKQVFKKCGPKTALKLTKDKAALKNLLTENQDAASRYLLNKKIISFREIPEELSKHIVEKVNAALYENEVMNDQTIDLRDFMSL